MELPIILALAFGIFYLMSSRTRKMQRQAADFRANLAPGQDVMTGSGLFGTVVAVQDDVITLEISPGVTSRWLRPAIAKLVEPPVATEDDEEWEDEGDDSPLTSSGSTPIRLTKDTAARPGVPDDVSSLTDETDPGEPRR